MKKIFYLFVLFICTLSNDINAQSDSFFSSTYSSYDINRTGMADNYDGGAFLNPMVSESVPLETGLLTFLSCGIVYLIGSNRKEKKI